MSDLIARAKAALEGVTAGPWDAPETLLGQRCTTVFGKDRKHVLYHAGTDANARFTAAARTLVPELVAEVERLRSRVVKDFAEKDRLHGLLARRPLVPIVDDLGPERHDALRDERDELLTRVDELTTELRELKAARNRETTP